MKQKRLYKIVVLTCFLFMSLPLHNVLGRVNEKTISFSATTGHNHDGGNGGKKVDSSDVTYDNSGSTLTAVEVESALDELDTDKINTSEIGSANGVAPLGADSKVSVTYLPAIAITDVNVCANEACQLALVAEEGDVCIRSDENKSYIHNGGIAGDMTDWSVLLSVGVVTSVNGEVGAIANVERTTRLQTTLTDSDTNYPSSGAVVDYTTGQISTHTSSASAHHTKTTSFGDLVDTASDAQIPNNITIDYAASSGNADTVDTKHFTDIQSDTASQISTHTSSASAHHDSLSNNYDITPATVTTTGIIKINSDSTAVKLLFGASGDVNLYRSAANVLRTDYNIVVDQGLLVDNDNIGNKLFFGSAQDTNLYRSTANVLRTDDSFYAPLFRAEAPSSYTLYAQDATAASGDLAMYLDLTAEAVARWALYYNGKIEVGSGSAARDVNLYRNAANEWKTDDNFVIAGGSLTIGDDVVLTDGGTNILSSTDRIQLSRANQEYGFGHRISGDTNPRVATYIDTAGFSGFWFGNGTDAVDTSLYRSAANVLKTDDAFTVAGTASTISHAASTKYVWISAPDAALDSSNPAVINLSQFSIWPTAADSAFDVAWAPVHLPKGGTVTRLDAYGITQASANDAVQVSLVRTAYNSTSYSVMASCSFSNSGVSCNDTTVANSAIDSTYYYALLIEVKADGTPQDAKFYKCAVSYTTTDVGQTQ